MPESESAQRKTARKSAAANVAARDEAAKSVAAAQQAGADAFEAQHTAKVELQNARFAELGESLAVPSALDALGVKVNK
jgi:hypothetical protein